VRPLVVSAVCLLALAACTPPSDAPRNVPPPPSGPVEDDPEALVARLGPSALADAFRRLDASAYDATVVVEELDASGTPAGRFERAVRHTPGAGERAPRTRATGTLADTSGLDPARLRLRDPLPAVLPDTPAYLAPATRDQYAARLGPRRGSVRTVGVTHDADTEQAVESVVARVDTATGDVLRIAVVRSSRSAIYSEATQADVRLRPAPGGPLPVAVQTSSVVSTPLSGVRTYRVTWRIAPAPGQTNTRNP
jgi:hypothetical protein